jgi:hypothetical protein
MASPKGSRIGLDVMMAIAESAPHRALIGPVCGKSERRPKGPKGRGAVNRAAATSALAGIKWRGKEP